MAFIPAGDTDKLFLAFVIITLFLYWRNSESVSKLGATRKKKRRLLFQIEKGNKSKESKYLFLLALAITRQLDKLNKICSLLLNAYGIYIFVQKQQSHTSNEKSTLVQLSTIFLLTSKVFCVISKSNTQYFLISYWFCFILFCFHL